MEIGADMFNSGCSSRLTVSILSWGTEIELGFRRTVKIEAKLSRNEFILRRFSVIETFDRPVQLA